MKHLFQVAFVSHQLYKITRNTHIPAIQRLFNSTIYINVVIPDLKKFIPILHFLIICLTNFVMSLVWLSEMLGQIISHSFPFYIKG